MQVSQLKLAEVIWLDAHVIGGGAWTAAEEVEKKSAIPALCRSVGYVVHNNPAVVALAPTYSTDAATPDDVGEFGPTLSIPRGMVKKIRYLK
jgi:hypothetical protein